MRRIFLMCVALTSTAFANDVARTIYNEARGEGELGMRAVATVIHNRTLRSPQTPRLGWDAGLVKIVSAPHQFGGYRPQLSTSDYRTLEYKIALRIANELEGRKFEPLGNWTHFYNPKLAQPKWGDKLIDVELIGNHKFGRFE